MSVFRRNFQPLPILIDESTITLTASRQRRTLNLKEKLPPFLRKKVAHVVGFVAELDLDPTFTTAPTSVQLANSLRSLIMRGEEGRIVADATGPDLRALAAYENGGRLQEADPDTSSGSTNNFYSQLSLDMGPGQFDGNPSDFAFPCVLLDNAVLDVEAPSFTDISADTTAGTVVQRIYAVCIGLDELRIPPKVDVRSYSAAANVLELGERALITSMLMLNSSSHDAITAGDFGNITLADREGNVYAGIPAPLLGRVFNKHNGQGQFGLIAGEPRAATDDNVKVVNSGTPTALVGATAAYQPVLWSAPGSRITKLEVEGPLSVRWSGSQSTAYFVVRRILPRTQQEVTDMATLAFNKLGLAFGGGGIKTLSKKPFTSPVRADYMPWAFKVKR